MENIFQKDNYFNNLSVKDLVEARDLFHIHLMNKANVVGTAIGRYRIRLEDIDKNGKIKKNPASKTTPRFFNNSRVVDESWPCILVMVDEWKTKEQLYAQYDISQAIPKSIYMPDGRVVPICVMVAPKEDSSDINIDEKELVYPDSKIGGGYPLLVRSQGIEKLASVGCVVTDGNKYYALTNKHILDSSGTPVFTKVKNQYRAIGRSTNKQLSNLKFGEVYDHWVQPNLYVNADVALIEIDDINDWKTDIWGIGQLGKMIDLHSQNMTLKLIGLKVLAHGAVSGRMEGEISALFYRYKSVGGYEYVADFLIGPKDGEPSLPTKHGDSGTVWVVEHKGETKTEYLPIAIQWGQRTVFEKNKVNDNTFALATNLSHVCRALEVDIVRDWNLDLDFTWGKTGHFKIGYSACGIVSNPNLQKLLTANAANIGISNDDLIKGEVPGGMYSADFVPLTDVPDMYWRNTRKADSSNHFADMDAQHDDVYHGKSLLQLCFDSSGEINDEWVDVDKWLDYYKKLDIADPEENGRPRLGGLPFRVWQMYNEMVEILKGNDSVHDKIAKFVCAGGTMSHYIGDACQPLHISYLHDGYPDGNGKGVHTAYETTMLDRYKTKAEFDLLGSIDDELEPVKKKDLVKGGKNAAKKVLQLMKETYELMPPQEIVDVYINNGHSVKALWENFGDRTIRTIANGVYTMAAMWQSAWVEGKGDDLNASLKKVPQADLMEWYKTPGFVKAFKLNDPELKNRLT